MNYTGQVKEVLEKQRMDDESIELSKIYDRNVLPILKDTYKLSNKELDVSRYIFLGLNNKEIAARMEVHEKTTKFHLTRIYKKLYTNSRLKLQSLFVYWAVI